MKKQIEKKTKTVKQSQAMAALPSINNPVNKMS